MVEQSNDTDAFVGDKVESELSKLLYGFNNNSLKRHKMRPPSLYERATANIGLTATYAVLIIAILYTLLRGLDYSAFRENRQEYQESDYQGAEYGRWAEQRSATQASAQQNDPKLD